MTARCSALHRARSGRMRRPWARLGFVALAMAISACSLTGDLDDDFYLRVDAGAAGAGGSGAGGDGGTAGEGGEIPGGCFNQKKNGMETDIDCGGPVCPACPDGKVCYQPSDCLSGVCNANLCGP